MKKQYAASLILLLALVGFAGPDSGVHKVRRYRQTHELTLLTEYMQFLAIPNVAADSANLRQTASFILGMMQKRGIKGQLLPAKTPGVPPAVYGEVRTPGAKRTIVFYAHYDGQPVNAAQWASGLSPFKPQLTSAALTHGGNLSR
ncbi:hypothetical protein [Hymenobacter qilianensis]|uniref:hypothetical protein n=1 Tax=Hymenobacter qilianensis TaxID=1385715 RepID=UPI001CB992EA|nr:hypothetical protein [Hymenobacter qilianensis]